MSSRPRDLPRPLNERQQRFVDAYLISLNATQAAIEAGYSAKTAEVKGYQLIQKDSVQIELQAAATALRERTGVTLERLIDEWADIGFDTPDKPVTWEAKTRALSELSARLWPIPKAEAERPAAITVRVLYEDAQGGKGGVQVRVE